MRSRSGTGPTSERAAAAVELAGEFRAQVEAYRKHARVRRDGGDGRVFEIDPLLLQVIDELGRRVLAEADPVLALERLLGRQGSEQSAKTTARDRDIARAVVNKLDGGSALEQAVTETAKAFGQSADEVRTIYVNGRIEAKAAQHQI